VTDTCFFKDHWLMLAQTIGIQCSAMLSTTQQCCLH